MRRNMIYSLVGIIAVAVLSLGATFLTGKTPLLGLDLRGGVSVVLQPQGTVDNATLQTAVSIIDNRVNALGVANSEIQRQGKDVVISLPGIKDSQSALKTLGTTAQLYFRPVICEVPAYAPTVASTTTVPSSTTVPTASAPTTTPKAFGAPVTARLTAAFKSTSPSTTAPAAVTTAVTTPVTTAVTTPASTPSTTAPSAAAIAAAEKAAAALGANGTISAATCSASNASQIPSTTPGNITETATVLVPPAPGSGISNQYRFVLGPADLTGRAVSSAYVSVSSTGAYTVELQFTSSGGSAFDRIAATRYKYYSASSTDVRSLEAVELDGQVESAPTIQSASFHGQASISGSFTSSQASNLALVLKYGSLPVRFTPQSVQTVSATLGKDSLRAGLLAGAGGIIVVLLYVILYYRALGLVVVLGLGVGGSILYSLLTLLSQTSSLALTLSGVTGIIVSVGITVDSYVVYFERLKDEVRSGRTIRQSTERSFSRAWRTVLTADSVSFLAALILYALTVGDVRGFAFTLGLSTLLDIATAWFFIRPMVVLLGRRRSITENRIIGVARGLGAARGTV